MRRITHLIGKRFIAGKIGIVPHYFGSSNPMKKYLFITVIALIAFFAGTAESGQVKDFVEAARQQVGKTLYYDPSYQVLDYPNGDVPIERGVCTDVVVRAMRDAYNYDLQKFVHEDMKKNFSKYPQNWGSKKPDKNIDHRRVLNLRAFFKRKGWSLPLSKIPSEFQPGDLVTCTIPPNLPHIMIVSDKKNKYKVPFVIHNIGGGAQEEDRLFEFELTGHYRIKGIEPVVSADRQERTTAAD
jgi:uncharacterized protein YijF (DUF1287 family)